MTKAQIDVGALKARIHLELFRDRKNNEIIKGEKELVAKIKSKSRNKTEEILLAERVVNGLKLAQGISYFIKHVTSWLDMLPVSEDRHILLLKI